MTEKVQSKNWPNTQWKRKQQPTVVLPKIKDLPINKENVLSKPLKIPEIQFRTLEDREQYNNLSNMIRTNIFPGAQRAVSATSYSSIYRNPFQEPLYIPPKSSNDHRRKKQGFIKRLEHDLDYKRIQAAWKEYYESQPPLINWAQRYQQGQKPKSERPKPKPVPVKRKKKPPRSEPQQKLPPDPQIPSPDMGDMDVFRAHNTPDWAKDAESVPEEIQPMDNDEFWAFYDDPF